MLPDNISPFIAGPMITDPHLFVGRKEELDTLVANMVGTQPISINVFGEKRVGKSSLLYHFYQTWVQRVKNAHQYAVIYISLQEADCQSEQGFYRAIATDLLDQAIVKIRRELATPLGINPLDRQTFASAMVIWKSLSVLPVICLDEFEQLLTHKDEFDNGFYNNLRSLMDNCSLMLVIASRKSLDTYQTKYQFTSSFFNLGHILALGDFTDQEVEDLVCLPASTIPHEKSALSVEKQKLAKSWGKQHPFRLQLAARFLFVAQERNQDIAWAKKQFMRESQRVFKSKRLPIQDLSSLQWLLWNIPRILGDIVSGANESALKTRSWLIGFLFLASLFTTLIGIQNEQMKQIQNLIWKRIENLIGG